MHDLFNLHNAIVYCESARRVCVLRGGCARRWRIYEMTGIFEQRREVSTQILGVGSNARSLFGRRKPRHEAVIPAPRACVGND